MFSHRILIAFWLLAVHFAAAFDFLEEPNKCLTEGAPVCAQSDTGAYVLFPNECLLNQSINEIFRQDPGFRKVELRQCLNDCNLVCSKAKQPICAVNVVTKEQRTFPSNCKMAKYACLTETDWQYRNAGYCHAKKARTRKSNKMARLQRKIRKPVKCTKKFNPVCASLSGVRSTFINECLLNAENLNTGKNWKIFAAGVCAEDAKSFRHYSPRIAKRELPAQNSDQKALDFDYTDAELNDDFTLIYVPPVFQTEFLDDVDMQPVAAAKQFKMVQNHKKTLPTKRSEINWVFTKASSVEDKSHKSSKSKRQPIAQIDRVPTFCKFGNNPICGSMDHKKRSFNNFCELITFNMQQKQNWLVLHTGKCNECVLNCNKAYDPICVSRSGINYTLANECYLNYGICQEKLGRVWKKISHGECQTSNEYVIKDRYATAAPGYSYTSSYGLVKPKSDITSNSPPTVLTTAGTNSAHLVKVYSNKKPAKISGTLSSGRSAVSKQAAARKS